MKTFQIIAIEDGFDFRTGAREMSVIVGLGKASVKIPVEQSAAEFLISLRTSAKAALKQSAATVTAPRPAPSEEPEETDEEEDGPIRLGERDEEEEL